MTVSVVVSPEAEAQIRLIDAWWREHRTAAADLFVEELASAIEVLEAMPFAGRRVDHPDIRGLRRTLLRATRYHVYYVVAEDKLLVLAIWSSVRGTGPDLRIP